MNLNKEVLGTRWDEIRQNVLNRWNRRRNDQRTRINKVREHAIGILQLRYGYTREQATYQLDKHYPRARLG